jgi:hypothetical protein
VNARFADWDTALATHLGTNVRRSSIENREAFTEVAEASYQFAASYVKDTGLPVRHDDVATQLVGVLATNGPLREYLSGKKLRQKYWYRYFADLILDRVWKELTDEPSAIAWGGGACPRLHRQGH